jgi:hypothetical protein
MKTYHGWRDVDGLCHITVREAGKVGRRLNPRLGLFNHSPTGFEWGYGGSGPAQTALALLADALGDDGRALRLHQDFKWRVIGPLPRREPWQMTDEQIRQIAADLEQRASA